MNNLSAFNLKEKVSQNIIRPSSRGLSSISQLFRESWKIYCSRIKALLGIMIIPVILSFLEILDIWGQGGAFYLLASFFWFLSLPALVFSIKDGIGVKESYKKASKILISYFWINFLTTLIIIGGFLLLIIPGFIFSVWLCFADYALLFEGKKGLKALTRSKNLVSGNFLEVLWRISAFLIAIFVISRFVIFLGTALGSKEFIGISLPFLQLFIVPIFVIYQILIYKELVRIEDEKDKV